MASLDSNGFTPNPRPFRPPEDHADLYQVLSRNSREETRIDPPRQPKINRPHINQAGLKVRLADLFEQRTKTQSGLALLVLAIVIFGVYVTLTTWSTDNRLKTEVAQLTKEANQASLTGTGINSSNTNAVSTVRPSTKVVAAYAVAPNDPKYLKIPAIGVDAMVTQVGILSNGALGTPPNIYETSWYTGSALPGQAGATLIDGHVSSWTAKGVFYNLYKLQSGDSIQIIKGDNSAVNYRVVKTQTYNSNNVNMQAAITPVDSNVSGLNLITCTGQVIKGTSLFNERVIVFAKEV